MGIFKKRKYFTINVVNKDIDDKEEINQPNIPNGMWVKCSKCNKITYAKTVEQNNKICPLCNSYFRFSAKERIQSLVDEETFEEFNNDLLSNNPLKFPGYDEKLKKERQKSELNDGVITGVCSIGGNKVVLAVMDSNFMMGSMGTIVGEKITFAIEKATSLKLPVIIFTCSGGARMQEGILSLMQMAKTSAAIKKHSDQGNLYISVITDPTTGGVTASFASLGDIILSEPNALIGFAGRRVIEGTINQKLPEDFQTAEFMLEHGFIDKIVKREEMKSVLSKILDIHSTSNKEEK